MEQDPTGDKVVIGLWDGAVVHDLLGRRDPVRLASRGGQVQSVAFSSMGDDIVTATPYGVQIWRAEGGSYPPEESLSLDVSVKLDSAFFEMGTRDGVILWSDGLATRRDVGDLRAQLGRALNRESN